MANSLHITLDPTGKIPLTEQIRIGIGAAISDGRLQPGARLPSWRDLAAQLGVARGTVQAAYERLIDAQLIVTSGPAGTHVAARPPLGSPAVEQDEPTPLAQMFQDFSAAPLTFQMGVPAQDAFPFKSWSRLMARAARMSAASPVSYPDPRGLPALRREVASYLAIARGIACAPSQIVITGGYAGALGLVLRALALEGARCWTEEPGYPITRTALGLAQMTPVPVRVDADGLVVEDGIAVAPDAKLAIVTPGQQAPLGVALSPARRQALLDWAVRSNAWIIEDDYLSELQLKGRAAPALAAADRGGRVIHIGSFSKTISPTLRLGFLVVPTALVGQVGDIAATLAPAPHAAIQYAVAEFIRDGHYLRHLRRMKRLYAARRNALVACLGDRAQMEVMAGLAVLLRLPDGMRDTEIARQALAIGLRPSPLSSWYAQPGSRVAGLLLGVTNLPDKQLAASCAQLQALIDKAG